MKIKILSFMLSNHQTDVSERAFHDKDINSEINQFIEFKEVISISSEIATIDRHNNGRCDTVYIIYTIMYKDIVT